MKDQHQQQYGTFMYPQPMPPTGAYPPQQLPYHHVPVPVPPLEAYQHQQQYQQVVAEGRPLLLVRHERRPRLPCCCGMGMGWFLFIIGFFLAGIPWYVGAMLMLCVRVDPREKPGFIACTIAAVLASIAIILGVTTESDVW